MTNTFRAFSLLSIVALSSAACGDDDDAPFSPGGGSAGVAGAAGSAGSAGSAGGPVVRAYDALAYDLQARFDWGRGVLVASERVTLDLAVAEGPALVELDAAVAIKRVYAEDGAELPFGVDAAASVVRVDLSGFGPGGGERAFRVDYEAPVSAGLINYVARDSDPVRSRVVSTDSEPRDGVTWLVAHHHPSDRARWAVELTVAPDEDVVANGARVADEVVNGERRVRYEMAQPLPTYLMAFAAGQIEHRDRAGGRVPLSVWYRRGLSFEPERHLDLLADLMAKLESRVGPYPWQSYAVVLLPSQPGGMENATITFNVETSGQGEINVSLNAHELAHQWFGNWVTMRDYDDVWFKEGMATLLAAEVQRTENDLEGKGRLFGRDFSFNPNDAVVDRELKEQAKYTSGPYQRAAWVMTQIRAKVGDEAFWASLRGLLAAHALGDVDGETFVRGFAPALDEASIQQILATLERKPPPTFGVTATPAADGQGTVLRFDVGDPSAALLVPPGVTVVDALGQATPFAITPGVPLEVVVPTGGYVAPDEADLLPYFSASFGIDPELFYEALPPALWPSAPAALLAAGARSAAHQEQALQLVGLPPTLGPEAYGAFYAQLDSLRGRFSASISGCDARQATVDAGQDDGPWVAALTPLLGQPPRAFFSSAFSSCGTVLATQLFGAEFAQAAAALDATNAGRFSYLLGFDYGPGPSFAAASLAATQAPSLLLRDRALTRLARQANFGFGYTSVPLEEAPAWKAFFRERLAEATSATRFNTVWLGVKGLVDDVALVPVAQKLHQIALSNQRRREVVCEAFSLAAVREGAWEEFRQAAQPWDALGPEAAAALADPAACAAERVRPAAAAERAARSRARARVEQALPDSPALRAGHADGLNDGASF